MISNIMSSIHEISRTFTEEHDCVVTLHQWAFVESVKPGENLIKQFLIIVLMLWRFSADVQCSIEIGYVKKTDFCIVTTQPNNNLT